MTTPASGPIPTPSSRSHARLIAMKRSLTFAVIALQISAALSAAEQPESNAPKTIPSTRPEMKLALEALKRRQPRLPLPESAGDGGANNGRMRAAYLPESWIAGGANRSRWTPGRPSNNGAPTLDYMLTTSCFWVVSRGNNCHYCLGHQELKLAGAGVPDDKIAALDGRWIDFDPRTQAALTYARKLTLEPQLIGDDDIATLKSRFTDAEIIELTFAISRFNATNRWTDGLGIPQDSRFGEEASALLTPTSEEFSNMTSRVTPDTRLPRGSLPSTAQIAEAIAACRLRQPRVAIPSAADAKQALSDSIGDRRPAVGERALSGLPEVGKSHVTAWNAIMNDEHLTPRLKASLAYITAVNNRAWYAAAIAAHRLTPFGPVTNELLAPDASKTIHPGEAAAYRLAHKLTVDPHLIADQDIASVRQHFSDAETAQIVHVICMANLFDRFTESLGLPLD